MRAWICDFLNYYQLLPQVIDQYEYISFDIFDTLIQRKCGNPVNIFHIVEEKYNISHAQTIESFCEVRINAELKARRKSNRREITIDDIYREIDSSYLCQEMTLLKQLELETEFEECIGRQDIVSLYEKAVKKKKVIIISDMYLQTDFLKSILDKNHISLPLRVFVSSECNALKSDGTLFKLALDEINWKPNNVLHIGDNFKSDFIRPKLTGMHSFIINRQ